MANRNIIIDTATYAGLTAEIGRMTDAGLAYCIQYGFAQSLQDAVAGTAKAVRDAAQACHVGGDGFDKAYGRWSKLADAAGQDAIGYDDKAVVELVSAFHVAADQKARFDAIMAGTVGDGIGGVRLDPVTRNMREAAEAVIRQTCKDLGEKLPKGKELADMIAEYVADNEAELRADAETAIAKAAQRAAKMAGLVAKKA